jgi:hypothetical protein
MYIHYIDKYKKTYMISIAEIFQSVKRLKECRQPGFLNPNQ